MLNGHYANATGIRRPRIRVAMRDSKESKGDREIIDPIFRSKYHEGKFSEATDDYRNWTVEITLNDLRESGETISFDILYK